LRMRLGASDRNHARAEVRRPLPGRKSSTYETTKHEPIAANDQAVAPYQA
jgi:hypothetical protein